MTDEIAVVLKSLGLETQNDALYLAAFTHPSFIHEHRSSEESYDRLEFIGDGVFDLVVADLIYKHKPGLDSGKMTKYRAYLVKGASLCNYGRRFNLGPAILLGAGEIKAGSKNSNNILEDVMEAFIGALYLDKGYEFIYSFIKKHFLDDLLKISLIAIEDYKSKLQETIQADYRSNVVYKVIKEEGSSQEKVFEIAVSFNETVLGIGRGKSKKTAEQNAAKEALEKLVK